MESQAWPADAASLEALQVELAHRADLQPRWTIPPGELRVGAVFVAARAHRLWAAAVVYERGARIDQAITHGESHEPYVPGLLALREGPALERVVLSLGSTPAVVLVNATGRDHPRGAGLALHLGAVLDVPTVGITDRPLVAAGPPPAARRGSTAPLVMEGRVVGVQMRTRTAVRSVCVHAAWRTSAETACEVVRLAGGRVRTPRPLREARRLARQARSRDR